MRDGAYLREPGLPAAAPKRDESGRLKRGVLSHATDAERKAYDEADWQEKREAMARYLAGLASHLERNGQIQRWRERGGLDEESIRWLRRRAFELIRSPQAKNQTQLNF